MPEHIDIAVVGYWAFVAVVAGLLAWVAIRSEPPRAA